MADKDQARLRLTFGGYAMADRCSLCPDCASSTVVPQTWLKSRWRVRVDDTWYEVDPPSYQCGDCGAYIWQVRGVWCCLDAVPF